MYKKFMIVFILCVVGLLGCESSNDTDENVNAKPTKEVMTKEPLVKGMKTKTFKTLGISGLKDEAAKGADDAEKEREKEYPKEIHEDGLEYKVEYLDADLMSKYAVRLTVVPIDSLDIEKVEYVRVGDKAVGIEQAEVDGELWYKVRTKGVEGWGPAADFKTFNAKTTVIRLNNGGSPFASSVKEPHFVYAGKSKQGYVVFDKEYDNLAGMKNEDTFFYIWGGTKEFDMFDSKNTHFVVKKDSLEGLEGSEKITITDDEAGIYHYVKSKEYEVDSRGVGLDDGVDYWDEITSEGEEERATFQVTDDFKISNIIVFVPDYDLNLD